MFAILTVSRKRDTSVGLQPGDGEAAMRTAAEIRRKLREVERKKQQKPHLWNVLVLDVYSEILEWVLGQKKPKRT